jgi:acyl-CoA synthetase (AMP-forming)/AMP-acid ligase II
MAVSGAEPVRHETIERFSRTFAPCGFRRDAFYPSYGLAEATLFVAGGVPERAPVVRTLARAALEAGRAVDVPPDAPGAVAAVGCGRALPGQRVVVVDPETATPCATDVVGEIWVAGPSVAAGYWERPDDTAAAFGARLADGDGPFLRTGDLGFLSDGVLFVAGRIKDLVIVDGRNHWPPDLEATVATSHAALRPNAGAAFAVDRDGRERLVVVQEVARPHAVDAAAVVAAIRRAVAEEHDVAVDGVALVRPGSVPKTSSGKIQRHACRAAWVAGELDAIAVWAADAPAAGAA